MSEDDPQDPTDEEETGEDGNGRESEADREQAAEDFWREVEVAGGDDGHETGDGDGDTDGDGPGGDASPTRGDVGRDVDAAEPAAPTAGAEEEAGEDTAADPETQDDAPMADLRRRIEERAHGEVENGADGEDPRTDVDFEDAFEEMDMDDEAGSGIEADDVWAELEGGGEARAEAVGERVRTDEDRDVRHIPKSTCHSCPYFGEPPEVACTHEGTEIREVVGPEEFEVVDCPVVAQDDELGGP